MFHLVLALLLSTSSFQGSGGSPLFQGVGDLPGDDFLSFANALPADGSFVVGGSNADDPLVANDGDSATWSHATQGFRWTPPGPGLASLEGFGYPFDGVHPESNVIGVAPDGTVMVGSATFGPAVPTQFLPVVWSGPGIFQSLGILAGHASGSAFAVADDLPMSPGSVRGPRHAKRIAVGYSTSASNHSHRVPGALPVFWILPGTTPIPLPLPVGSSFTMGDARAVSRDGRVIVGNLYDFTSGPTVLSQACAWVWGKGRGHGVDRFELLLLAAPAGRLSSWVGGLSADGSTVVGMGIDEIFEFGTNTPCLWRASGTAAQPAFGAPEIPSLLPGASGGSLSAASADGSVLGGQCIIDFVPHAVRWSGAGHATVEDVLVTATALGQDLDTWTLWYVTAMTPDGSTLIGTGDHLDEADAFLIEGWYARLPLP